MEAARSDGYADHAEGPFPDVLLSELSILNPTTAMGTAIIDKNHCTIANRLIRSGVLELINTMSKPPLFSALLVREECRLSVSSRVIPLPPILSQPQLTHPLSEASMPSAISRKVPLGNQNTSHVLIPQFSTDDSRDGHASRAAALSRALPHGLSSNAISSEGRTPVTSPRLADFAPLAMHIHLASRDDLQLLSPQAGTEGLARSAGGVDEFSRVSTSNLVDLNEDNHAEPPNHGLTPERERGETASAHDHPSTPVMEENPDEEVLGNQRQAMLWLPTTGSMLSLTLPMTTGVSHDNFDLLRQSLSLLDTQGSICRERPRVAMKQGGCIIFTDDYYESNAHSPATLIAEEYRRYHTERQTDRSHLEKINSKSYISKETKTVYVEAQVGLRPVYRRRSSVDVYGRAEYIPVHEPPVPTAINGHLSDTFVEDDVVLATSTEEEKSEQEDSGPLAGAGSLPNPFSITTKTMNPINDSVGGVNRLRCTRSDTDDDRSAQTDDAPTDAPLMMFCQTPESPTVPLQSNRTPL